MRGSAAVVIPLQLQEATTSRESLAKTLYLVVLFSFSHFHLLKLLIYSQLFAWIVKTINTRIDPPTADSSIGILDIFGFESFQVFSFKIDIFEYSLLLEKFF